MPDTQTIILIILAVLLGGKPVLLLLSKWLPFLVPFIALFEKLDINPTPPWAKQLQEHYNEETTAALTNMSKTLIEIKEENIKHHQFEEGKFELLEEIIKNSK